MKMYTAVLQYLYHQYHYYAVQHVSQAPPGRAKCPADPHARRRPKREAEGREPAAAGHGDRGAILAGAAVSPPGPQRIIAQMLRACGIQVLNLVLNLVQVRSKYQVPGTRVHAILACQILTCKNFDMSKF